MKRWLMISLLFNVVLVAVLAMKAAPVDATGSRHVPWGNPSGTFASQEGKPVRGTSIRSTSSYGSVEDLRRAGASESLVAMAATAYHEERWQKQLGVLRKQFERGEISEIDLERFIAGHDAFLEAGMQAALGEAGFRRWDRQRLLGGFDLESLKLSDPEADNLYQIQLALSQQRRDLQSALLEGNIDEAGLEQQTETNQQAYEQRLAMLLGETRYATLHPADSVTGELRRNLARIKASDEQVQGMLAAQRQWQEARDQVEAESRMGKLSGPEYEGRLQDLMADRDRHFMETLGEGTFTELQKNQDSRYRTLQQHANVWGLSEADVNFLYDSIRNQESNPHDGRTTEEALQGYLGAERFALLKRSGLMNSTSLQQ